MSRRTKFVVAAAAGVVLTPVVFAGSWYGAAVQSGDQPSPRQILAGEPDLPQPDPQLADAIVEGRQHVHGKQFLYIEDDNGSVETNELLVEVTGWVKLGEKADYSDCSYNVRVQQLPAKYPFSDESGPVPFFQAEDIGTFAESKEPGKPPELQFSHVGENPGVDPFIPVPYVPEGSYDRTQTENTLCSLALVPRVYKVKDPSSGSLEPKESAWEDVGKRINAAYWDSTLSHKYSNALTKAIARAQYLLTSPRELPPEDKIAVTREGDATTITSRYNPLLLDEWTFKNFNSS